MLLLPEKCITPTGVDYFSTPWKSLTFVTHAANDFHA
jgi:hypothetical protein